MRSSFFTAALLAAILAMAGIASGAIGTAARTKTSLRAPSLQSPANGASSNVVPPFTWAPVHGAGSYEFQLSADGAFRSSVFGPTKPTVRTKNTAASSDTALADGSYFWRVRAIGVKGGAGPWSQTRRINKEWSQQPQLQAPAQDATINYPQPVVLSWSPVPRAFKYEMMVATDPALGSPAPYFDKPIQTSGTDFAIGVAFTPGRYYWAITPLDADKHKGQRSAIHSFTIGWPSATTTHVEDLNPDDRIYDPKFSWDPVPGAARYDVEVNGSDDFAAGSKVCCSDPTTGTSLSPTKVLPNNTGAGGGYFWRVRAIDVDGNAGAWNLGPSFPKYFSPASAASIPNLRLLDHTIDLPAGGTPSVQDPVVAWDPTPGASSYEIQVAPTVPVSTTFSSASGTTITVGSTAGMVPDTPISFANGNVRTLTSISDATHLVIDSSLSSNPPVGSAVMTRLNYCNWTPAPVDQREFWDVRTAATAWTPLSPGWSGVSPVGSIVQTVSYDAGRALQPGQRYCVRVRARGDRDAQSREVVSPWTELGDFVHGNPTFKFSPASAGSCSPLTQPQPSDYLSPQSGTVSPRLPLFTWRPIAGACSYYVVVARDESFTDIVDIALTNTPAYAPRANLNPKTYPDEASSYFWAVIPASASGVGAVWTDPKTNAYQDFHERSVPPTPADPVGGATVTSQPTFHWTTAEGARDYRLQVAQDPSFADPLDDVTTDATSFTSSTTYPSDTALYWRVRADDESRNGLAWSQVSTFKRQLPVPDPSPDNPTGGRTIPLLKWTPVPGAVSYDLHIDQPDGTQKDFNMRTAAFTPTAHYGTGVWTWKVRANFPKLPIGATPGAYSTSTPFTRFIGAPAAARGIASRTRTLISWDPVEMAKSYKVEISNVSSFATPIDSVTTDNTSYAPTLINPGFANGGRLYWRVASLDEGNNAGGYTTGTFSLPKRIKIALSGTLKRGRQAAVRVKVMDGRGRIVSKAKVRVSGSGVKALAKRASKRGVLIVKLTPRRRGKVSFLASKGGYRSGSATLKVG